MKTIQSRSNPLIKQALKAVNSPSSVEPLLLTEGHKLVEEALKSGARAQMVFVEQPQHLRGLKQLEACTYLVPMAILKELSTVQKTAEIVAFFAPPAGAEQAKLLQNANLLIVLDRLQDPGNLGTIMRTGEAMGADAIILLKGSCSPYNPKVIRAAMGSSFRLPVFADVCPKELFADLRKNSISTICADMHGTPLPQFTFPRRCALFFGQEGQGLAAEILKECSSKLAIPMLGQVESLNVATSAAICLYEWSRSRFSTKRI